MTPVTLSRHNLSSSASVSVSAQFKLLPLGTPSQCDVVPADHMVVYTTIRSDNFISSHRRCLLILFRSSPNLEGPSVRRQAVQCQHPGARNQRVSIIRTAYIKMKGPEPSPIMIAKSTDMTWTRARIRAIMEAARHWDSTFSTPPPPHTFFFGAPTGRMVVRVPDKCTTPSSR